MNNQIMKRTSYAVQHEPAPPLPKIPNANSYYMSFNYTIRKVVYTNDPARVPFLWYDETKREWQEWSSLPDKQRKLFEWTTVQEILGERARDHISGLLATAELEPKPKGLRKLLNKLSKY
jgi:hypothetical protein